jgi:hypothetical protein
MSSEPLSRSLCLSLSPFFLSYSSGLSTFEKSRNERRSRTAGLHFALVHVWQQTNVLRRSSPALGPASRVKGRQLIFVKVTVEWTRREWNELKAENGVWVCRYVDMYVCSTAIWQNAA